MVSQACNTPRASRGFTLVELMFSLSLSGILLMIGVPFTLAWMDSSRQLQVRGELLDAVGRAKSLALRNGSALASTQPVARLRVNAAGVLSVQDAVSNAVVWSAQLPPVVELELAGGAGFNCVAYNSRALPVAEAGCNQVTASTLVIKIDGREDLNAEVL